MAISDQGMKLGLWALNRFAGLGVLDRVGAREPAERLLHRASRDGTRTAARASRTFTAAAKLAQPSRLPAARSSGLFDLTPTDEQEMLVESFRSFAAERLRPAATEADAHSTPPAELMAQSSELGIAMLGVPEQLGGVFEERSATTSVLIAETLAHGDMGLAVAALAPAAVSTAISLWGDAEQQARYLPAFVGEEVPAAALALLEPRPLFDPMRLETRARRLEGGGFALDGLKALVPRAADAELFVVAAHVEGEGPALFVVESGTEGVLIAPEPAMGLRAAATGRLTLEDVQLPAEALLAGGAREAYAECVQRARLAWCAVAVGTARAVLDYVVPYVNERVAFGEPISNRQAVAFAVSNIGIELEGMRLTTLRAATRADQEKDFANATAVARQLCSEKGMAIGSDGVGLLGGHGFVTEYPVERWYRDLRAAGLMEGALLV
ncbi:MAG: Acyl-CoA dehydrogenase, Mycobacterial subgroup FadE24 [uncultured Solirubrobacterales bacterium]|uniref:Acyl-CoA dehydrogenase, Mycobacterial subgroup FadE24 n=1 Tax=uncultured Solirubrobacterales bacterium TaxID=768556 RepID=A0A6J4SYR1_9ACTN|nr:MAG: Acyl-CoA dehydrogenase, Mycobacterial subgroup FadE24 [uncultured Solirubrobacterales bacterium]